MVTADGTDDPGPTFARIGHRYRPGREEKGPNFLAKLELTDRSSSDVIYTVYVLDSDDREAVPVASQSIPGDGSTRLDFALVVEGDVQRDVPVVWFYATSSIEDRVSARIPEDGYIATGGRQMVEFEWWP